MNLPPDSGQKEKERERECIQNKFVKPEIRLTLPTL